MHFRQLWHLTLFAQNVRNLCSGFSYCFTILDALYVWHGRGAIDAERRAAVAYAQALAGAGGTVVELQEGVESSGDEDEMFWMILGDDDYAKADYWRWRGTTDAEARIFKVDTRASDVVCGFSLKHCQ